FIPIEVFKGAVGPKVYKYKCPPRSAIWILSRRYDNFQMRAEFKIPKAVKKAALSITGQDCDKPGSTTIRIEINGNEIFRGKNNLAKNGWSTRKFNLPDNILKSGVNEIVIENMEEAEDPFAKWFMVSAVEIEADMEPAVLLLAHFDNSLNADTAANPYASMEGSFKINPHGKWGGALDCGYSKGSYGRFWYNAPDNFNIEKGTAEMWVKLNWDPGTDTAYRSFLMPYGDFKRPTGFLLYKYHKTEKLSLLFYNNKKRRGITASMRNWKADTWHHIAITWDRKKNSVQLFFDGVLTAKSTAMPINSEPPLKIYLGSMCDNLNKSAGALIDEFRILDSVLWSGKKIGEQVFTPPETPYAF
ncbi:MAG: LamG-like jellyroll fold domain-containing protein, partial [Victivallaceae bacterium]